VWVLDRRDSYPNQQLRRAFLEFVRANALRIGPVGLGTVLAAGLLSWWLDGYIAGFLVGAGSTLMLTMIGLSFLLVSGTHLLAGSIGETNTADELRAASRKGHVFGSIDNLQVDGGDVDHLVVAPGGLLMIDSKWHSSTVTQQTLEKDAAAARAAAGRARNILRAVHVRRPAVRPVVVVWGGEQLTVTGQRVGDVDFVAGRDLRNWLGENASIGTAYNASQADGLLLDLRAFRRRVRPAQRRRAPAPLPSPSHT
jgi:hypothetical protein